MAVLGFCEFFPAPVGVNTTFRKSPQNILGSPNPSLPQELTPAAPEAPEQGQSTSVSLLSLQSFGASPWEAHSCPQTSQESSAPVHAFALQEGQWGRPVPPNLT